MPLKSSKLISYAIQNINNPEITQFLEGTPLETLIYHKISFFLEQLDSLNISDLYYTILRQMEKPLLFLVLNKTKNNQLHASNILGINRNTLRAKIENMGLYNQLKKKKKPTKKKPTKKTRRTTKKGK